MTNHEHISPAPEPNTGHSQLDRAVDAYLEARAKGPNTGNYRTTADTVLTNWITWCNDRDVTSLEDLSPHVLRRYAQHLRRRVRAESITASTAHTYYNIVRGCLSWCVKDSRLDSNPADTTTATDELPDNTEKTDTQQFWNPDTLHTITDHVNTQARTAINTTNTNETIPVRNRALVHLLAYSGARGAELFSSPNDTRDGRNGITWNRVHLSDSYLDVLGKNQTWEEAQLPDQAVHALEQHYRVQDPPTDDWPVFATHHAPTLYNHARTVLDERGYTPDEIEQFVETADTATSLLHTHKITPPAITTEGARSVMQRICDAADIDIDGEYLKPHGARRGLGGILYRENAELAQTALRHESIETTHDAYSDITASETSDNVSNVLNSTLNSTDDTDDTPTSE